MKSHLQRYLSGRGIYDYHRASFKAWDELYLCTVHPIYHACLLLLGKEKEAMVVAAKALRMAGFFLNRCGKGRPATMDDLMHHAMWWTVKYSMEAVLEHDPNAFLPPRGRNYRISTDSIPPAHTSVELLQSLPTLSRFVFVLSALAYSDRESVGDMFHLDDRNLDLALEAQPFVVEALVRRSSLPCDTYEQFVEYLKQEADTVELPTYVQECLQSLMREPRECEKERNRRGWIFALVWILLALLLTRLGILHW